MTTDKNPSSCRADPHDMSHNDSPNEHFDSVLQAHLSRRDLLRGGAATAAGAMLGSLGLAGHAQTSAGPQPAPPPLLGFQPVAKTLADAVTVPVGYTATILYALGDPLRSATPAYANNGADTDFESRCGDHHDGMDYFGLSNDGKPKADSSERAVLVINHESTTEEFVFGFSNPSQFLHVNGGTRLAQPPAPDYIRPVAEMDKEVAVHGLSVVEIRKANTGWRYVKDSPFNRRITPLTETQMNGPVRGNALLKTRFSTNGTRGRGTVNNCGGGHTPWGTYIAGEENWPDYFYRTPGDAANRTAKENYAFQRYGMVAGARYGWAFAADDKYKRWDVTRTGASVDGRDDYRNEMNSFGYIVEVNPYDRGASPRKRTALGRFLHESAAFGRVAVNEPIAAYMGDDTRNEYIYKYVSAAKWRAGDANPAVKDMLNIGDRYLDNGKLYVARFNADGSGEWRELTTAASTAAYTFASQADVLVHARIAADAVGATKMDRPEWGGVNPANGEIYFTLTNNSRRRVPPLSSGQAAVDSANPRVYFDSSSFVTGNGNGHIIRMREAGGKNNALQFSWDIYLFGAEADVANPTPVPYNLSQLGNDQDFSSPDGLVFTRSTGICWFQTDDSAYTNITNPMMMASLAGTVGDGAMVTLNYASGAINTFVGRPPGQNQLKRFLVGPVQCEITGLAETPDGKTVFVNIQHPGELTTYENVGNPTSRWPSNAGYGAGIRPRSATIAITRIDGQQVGR